MWDRTAIGQRNLEETLLAWSVALRMASGTSFCLAETCADMAIAIPDYDERREAEATAALDDLGDAVDVDDAVFKLAPLR